MPTIYPIRIIRASRKQVFQELGADAVMDTKHRDSSILGQGAQKGETVRGGLAGELFLVAKRHLLPPRNYMGSGRALQSLWSSSLKPCPWWVRVPGSALTIRRPILGSPSPLAI